MSTGHCPDPSVQTPCTKSTSSLGKKQREPRLYPSFFVVLLEFIPVSSRCPHARHCTQIPAGEINLIERFLTEHTSHASCRRDLQIIQGLAAWKVSSDHQILKKVKETAFKAQDTEQYPDKTGIFSITGEKRPYRMKHLSLHMESAFQENLHSTLFSLHVLSQDFKDKTIMFAIRRF